jgi:hypothetical protein
VLYFHSLLYCTPIYSWTIEQIDRDIYVKKDRAPTTFKLEGEVISLSESSQGEVGDNREKWGEEIPAWVPAM